jgi:hypothetical protein
VDRFGHQRPAGDLRVGVQTRSVWVALTHGTGLGALADDQPSAGTLGVVLSSELGWGFTMPARFRVSGAITRRLVNLSLPS